jgi:hypothetical protein
MIKIKFKLILNIFRDKLVTNLFEFYFMDLFEFYFY